MHKALGVRLCREPMAVFLEIPTNLPVIVDLPIEHDPDRSVLIVDWLMSPLHVDNRQPTHAQRDTITEKIPFVIRPAMRQECTQLPRVPLVTPTRVPTNYPYNPTHGR